MSSSPTSSSRRPWFRRVGLLILVLLILAGAYAGWKKWFGTKNPREEYQIATVQKGDIQDLVTATGTVQPRDYVDVGAQVSGQLRKLHVEVGSVVQSGDLLAEIDPTVFSATVEARRAGLRNQQATLKERESALALATLQFNRQKNLAAEDATTTESLQIAEASLRAAKAQIESVKAQIEQTESTLKADEATLNYARIYAPMSGTVVSVTARQGQTLNANQSAPTVLRIADLSTMTVQTQVSEAEVSKLRMGMEVYFTTLGSQGRRWYGSLRKVEPTPTVTNNVVLYNALFDVPNNNQALMPSMTTQVFFIAASAEDVLMVPTAAVTMSRAASGQHNRGNAAETGRGAASASASDAASGTKSASAPKTSRQEAAPAAPASAPAPRATGDMGRFASMSPEERRAAFEAMSPEERQAMRDRRRAQRDEQQSQGGGTSQATAPKAPASAASQAGRGDRAAAPEANASGPVSRGSNAGFSNAGNTRGPRRGTVKVIDAQGRIEERPVELGVTTRVQAQVLSGLVEGDQVITGLKLPPAAQQAQQRGQNQGGGLQQGSGNAPGAGAGRSR
jgi:macrolide-specific efflux system membrane fusion protein